MSPADPHFQAPAPAAHLSAALLRQYAAGTLAAAERRQVERHTLACALCADALDGYLQAAPAAVTPEALAELQQRLHARVATEPAAATRGGAWWMAAAAAVALLLVFVGLWQWPASPSKAPIAARQSTTAPVAATEPAAAEPSIAAAPTPEPAAAPAPPAVQPETTAAPVASASAPRRRRARPRPAVVAARSAAPKAATVLGNAAPISSATAADSSQALGWGATAAAPPAAVQQPAAEAADTAPAKPMAMARMAAAAPTDTAHAFREEASKRKAALPPAPALAPFPVGGYPALRTYLRREQQRPETGIGDQAHSDGIVKLKFMVEADGTVHNIQVVRGINAEYDEEAIRLICEGPAWRPAIVNGRRAAQAVRLDVPFH
ncbi:energy transducer TonB [Hymenobacter jeollabukensis]|uniref:TonB C-terminal domain-containing protein n=1 Tax=Hymenobacter jeollabukensis TaxID=2025313 RepID=A0A5R8WII8_9BACT|nr:energy transducer TonB [Hymenobacter jeollabukensis]TLM87912.1 hypothetical protein FDY95_25045 [Hymenobacter jeollabukensis]